MYAARVEVLTIDDFPVRKVRHAVEPGSNESRNIAAGGCIYTPRHIYNSRGLSDIDGEKESH